MNSCRWRLLPVNCKTPSQIWLGVFVWAWSILLFADCPPPLNAESVVLKSVIDGDTVLLMDGRKVRLIGVNTPELGRQGHPAEPFAVAAKQAVEQFFADSPQVQMEVGEESRDRYGRWLAHLFDGQGRSLEQILLSKGLAFALAIPPNLNWLKCRSAAENAAREGRRGVWRSPYFSALGVEAGVKPKPGFTLIQGVVKTVTESRHDWWLGVAADVVIRVPKDSRHHFKGRPQNWLGREVLARGWLVDRSGNKVVQKMGYARYMLRVEHPFMLHYSSDEY